jgi:hypothetical protein
MAQDTDNEELWTEFQTQLDDEDIVEILNDISDQMPDPIGKGEITMEKLESEYPNRSYSSLRSIMMRLVEAGKYKTRMAWDEEKRRSIRVWWKPKEEEQ